MRRFGSWPNPTFKCLAVIQRGYLPAVTYSQFESKGENHTFIQNVSNKAAPENQNPNYVGNFRPYSNRNLKRFPSASNLTTATHCFFTVTPFVRIMYHCRKPSLHSKGGLGWYCRFSLNVLPIIMMKLRKNSNHYVAHVKR